MITHDVSLANTARPRCMTETELDAVAFATDLSNPASNRCYARVGFCKTGEVFFQRCLR